MDKNYDFEFFLINFLNITIDYIEKILKKPLSFQFSIIKFNKDLIIKQINKQYYNKNDFTIIKSNENVINFCNYYIEKYLKNKNSKIINISNDKQNINLLMKIKNLSFLKNNSFYLYILKIKKNIYMFYLFGIPSTFDYKSFEINKKLEIIEKIFKSIIKNVNLVSNIPVFSIINSLRQTSFFIVDKDNRIITFYSSNTIFAKTIKGEKLDNIFTFIVKNKKSFKKKIIKECTVYANKYIFNDITVTEEFLDPDNIFSPKLIIFKNNFFYRKEQLISKIFSILYNKQKSDDKKFNEIIQRIRLFFDADYIFLSYPLLTNNANEKKSFTNIWEDFKNDEIKNFIYTAKEHITKESFKITNNIVYRNNKPVFFDKKLHEKDTGYETLRIKSQILMALRPKNTLPWLFGMCYIEKTVLLGPYDKELFNSLGLILTHFLESRQNTISLNESKESYKNLFQSIPLPAVVINKNLAILEANKYFLRLINKKNNEIKNKNIFDLLLFLNFKTKKADTNNSYYFNKENLTKKNIVKKEEFKSFLLNKTTNKQRFNIHLDNTDKIFIFEVHKKKIRSNENLKFFLIFYDLTEKFEYYKKIAEIEKLESLGKVSSTVAHEFNNLLTGINGNIDLIKFYIKSAKTNNKKISDIIAQLEESIYDINELTNKGKTLTTNLLGYSRKRPSKIEIVELNNYFQNEVKLLQQFIGERIKIKFTEWKNPLFIKIDKNGFSHVLMNLAVNAKDAMNDIGNISITLKSKILNKKDKEFIKTKNLFANISLNKNAQMALIKFSDNGKGIPQNIIDKVFDPFFTTKQETKGTGLGLSFVKGFIEQHNGFIIINSQENKGTTFKIYLPLINEKILQSSNSTKNLLSNNKKINRKQLKTHENLIKYQNFIKDNVSLILIIEDEKSILKYLHKTFNNMGIKTLTVNNYKDAQKIINTYSNNIDFVISDMILENKSGYDLYKNSKTLKETKWIFISGYPLSILNKWNYLKSDVVLIQKPFELEELLKQMYNLLTNKLL